MLVTGIQPTRVARRKDSFQPKDLGWLDPCDKHRDEEAAVFA
ncbi:integrase [Agrobacterium deltaense]|nr:integrase [Agrobacterium deltaense]